VTPKLSAGSLVVAGTLFALPLLILPARLSFSFDALPKALLLYAATALVLLLPGALTRSVANLFASRAGRAFVALAVLWSISLAVAAVTSLDPQLSWFGTRWRSFGALSQIAVLAIGVVAAGSFRASPRALLVSLRMLSLAGLCAAVYALLQFLGLDPLLDPHLYTLATAMHVTRPPSTFGHPGYLGGFETAVFFVSLGLRSRESRFIWRLLLAVCTVSALVAILISGTRAAVLAVLLCCPILLTRRARLAPGGRMPLLLLATSLAAFGMLLAAPQGEGLRLRLHQWIQDPGGPRSVLWKDTLRMIGSAPITGSGPETFAVVFPKFESRELYVRYPDFQQESPHNIFLDAAACQGIPGLIVLVLSIALGACCVWKTEDTNRELGRVLVAGLLALVIFHQFFAFTLPTFLTFLLLISALVGLSKPDRPALQSVPRPARVSFAVVRGAVALILLACAAQLDVTDHAFARIDALLKQGNLADGIEQYHQQRRLRLMGRGPDLWYSQQMVWAAQSLPDGALQQLARAEAVESSRIAFQAPGEDRVLAAYHRALLCASIGQEQTAETVTRKLSLDAPNWYQPHWILSRLLTANGRITDAKSEADLALDLAIHTPPQTLEQIKIYHDAVAHSL